MVAFSRSFVASAVEAAAGTKVAVSVTKGSILSSVENISRMGGGSGASIVGFGCIGSVSSSGGSSCSNCTTAAVAVLIELVVGALLNFSALILAFALVVVVFVLLPGLV